MSGMTIIIIIHITFSIIWTEYNKFTINLSSSCLKLCNGTAITLKRNSLKTPQTYSVLKKKNSIQKTRSV